MFFRFNFATECFCGYVFYIDGVDGVFNVTAIHNMNGLHRNNADAFNPICAPLF